MGERDLSVKRIFPEGSRDFFWSGGSRLVEQREGWKGREGGEGKKERKDSLERSDPSLPGRHAEGRGGLHWRFDGKFLSKKKKEDDETRGQRKETLSPFGRKKNEDATAFRKLDSELLRPSRQAQIPSGEVYRWKEG